jgi:hypothetical protein
MTDAPQRGCHPPSGPPPRLSDQVIRRTRLGDELIGSSLACASIISGFELAEVLDASTSRSAL